MKVLEIGDHAKSRNGMKSHGELAFIKLCTGELVESAKLLNEVEKKAYEFEDLEYQLRCLVNKALYVKFDINQIDVAVNEFQEAELYFNAMEVCQGISRFFEKEKDYYSDLKYTS